MVNPKHTLRKPFTITDEPIEGLAITIHKEEDEGDYDTDSEGDESEVIDIETDDVFSAYRVDSESDTEELL